ncbi:erythromycin esterase family protein [Deefgea rivuli]|uniref:erythromycin esterase family protein n=1 Tax=Deefgea rivuli TaxID=400948 RepID=UPI0005680324|nr:erythromycin esterase family protein [Deefgea rivuli]
MKINNWITCSLVTALSACGGGGSSLPVTPTPPAELGTTFKTKSSNVIVEVFLPDAIRDWVKGAASPIRSISAQANDDFADLAAFGNAIGDARIVSITEYAHGDANAFELMNRQVQYLHQKKGFDVLIMESAMFDVEAIWRSAMTKNASVADLAAGRVFFMYSKTDSGRKVLHYIDQQKTSARPLIFTGLGIPAGGDASIKEIAPALQLFLQNRKSTIPQQSNWAQFANIAQQAAALTSADIDKSVFYTVADQIKAEICSDPTIAATPRETAGWWCLQIKGLVAAAQRQTTLAKTGELPRYDPRETQMASNALWTIQQMHPNKKIIIWSNEVHGLNLKKEKCFLDNVRCEQLVNPEIAYSMAAHLRDALGKQLYIAKNTAQAGELTSFEGPGTFTLSNSLDNVLLSLNLLNSNQVFINAPSDGSMRTKLEKVKLPQNPSILDRSFAVLGREMDGLFYYPLATPAIRKDYPTNPLP